MARKKKEEVKEQSFQEVIESTLFEVWHVRDVEQSPEGKAELNRLRTLGFQMRKVSPEDLGAKFNSMKVEDRRESKISGMVYIAKGK